MLTSPMIMGVLNITPDSFSDGGKYLQKDKAIRHALTMQHAGADVIDIGAESSRPGSKEITLAEELDRVLPIIENLKHELTIPISVDTTKPAVMCEAIKLGAWMINDTNALLTDGAIPILAKTDCNIVLMHKKGKPETMQNNPRYHGDVVTEIYDFFVSRIKACVDAGISKERLWLDPGIGFGKTTQHNLSILKRIKTFMSLDLPLLVGVSRKTILKDITQQSVNKSLEVGLALAQQTSAGLAMHIYLLQQGVTMIRTHDVAEMRDAILVLQAMNE